MKLQIGQRVTFKGCSEAQQRWGRYANHKSLDVGRGYTVASIDIHSHHTRVGLVGVDGEFNSVCFEPLWVHFAA